MITMIVYQEHGSVSTMISAYEGFIVHPSYQVTGSRTRIFFVGRLRTGETFAVVEDREQPRFYLRGSDGERVGGLRELNSTELEQTDLRTADGEPVLRLCFPTITEQQNAAKAVDSRGIRSYEADIRFYDQYQIDKHITGSVFIDGTPVNGRRVDLVFHNPGLRPAGWVPKLSTLSVDIETNPYTDQIVSIALVTDDTWRQERSSEVLFLGSVEADDHVTCFADEKQMLEAFRDRVATLDPDIITGWNVIEFDFAVLYRRFSHFGIAFLLGRSDEPGNFLHGTGGQSSAVITPGRQVIDGMRIIRNGPLRFEDNRLETVAKEVLGTGKVSFTEEDNLKGKRKIDALLRTYREDPETFCRYNMRDAALVIDILEVTGLMELTIRRAALSGVGLARAWTSVASFEHLYITYMRKRHLVAPTKGVDAHEVSTAPGGAIIPPQPGFYKEVVLYDFKSLYPSIMRTFNIDPLSYVSSNTSLARDEPGDLIQAPNGTYFKREPAILPEILESFFENRETAKKGHDKVASYVYKIIMNSFYGVLGTPGCRFASSDIAGAITSFGHHLLNWCREHLQKLGHRVIYGDTDSLFVLLNPGIESDKAGETASDLNYALDRYVKQKWRVESRLELEYECIYLRFFLPPIRGPGEQLRGRAKGYAGLRVEPDGDGEPVFDIKGMEAARRDWTRAARKLQKQLLLMLFEDRPVEDLRGYIREYIQQLLAGEHDTDLVYKKALRKPVSSYTRSVPPHVKAAKALDPEDQEGVIQYLWTEAGPQPAGKLTAAIDYGHYLEKQLKPVAEGISLTLHADLGSLFTDSLQSDLF